jgi:hypothetical protein
VQFKCFPHPQGQGESEEDELRNTMQHTMQKEELFPMLSAQP